HTPLDLQGRDPALVGGDVAGGSASLDQLSVFRPVAGWSPYVVPVRGLFLCGASAAPGGGVHGMSGRSAARAVLRQGRLRRV
ncbi:MAG: oxidoreductase, partial [Frankiales bacterium]|nr:oxidoreductase [Frankiales bacterium]